MNTRVPESDYPSPLSPIYNANDCPKCKLALPMCRCSKKRGGGGSQGKQHNKENDSTQKPNTEATVEHQPGHLSLTSTPFTLKPGVQLRSIKELLEAHLKNLGFDPSNSDIKLEAKPGDTPQQQAQALLQMPKDAKPETFLQKLQDNKLIEPAQEFRFSTPSDRLTNPLQMTLRRP